MSNPMVSVITVCYNCVGTIERTIQSVVVQDYDNIEYIVIDGGSTDGTVDIIKRYANKISFWSSEPDKGIYDAMNKGIKRAHGEWIHFRNSGDYFLSKHTVSEVFRESYDNDISVVHGDCYYVYPNFYVRRTPTMLDHSYKDDMPVLHPATFVRTKLQQMRPFDLNYKSAADYNFFYWLCQDGHKFQYVPIVVATFATGGFSSNWERAFIEDRRIQGRMNGFVGKCGVYYELWKRKLWKVTKGKRVLKKALDDSIPGQISYDY